MKGRKRALGFISGAFICALLAASLANGDAPRPAAFGELRPVLVTTDELARGSAIANLAIRRHLTVRRVPATFAPPDALASPEQGAGRELALTLPPGSYLTASNLAVPTRPQTAQGRAPHGTTPVEIEVTGAGALLARQADSPIVVDVVVAGEAGPGPGAGRTFVAARAVRLLGLNEASGATGLPGGRFAATLALTRGQALDLIAADGVARSIRLLVAR